MSRCARDLAVVLRRYGFIGESPSPLLVANMPDGEPLPGLTRMPEPAGTFLDAARRSWFRKRRQYRALLPAVSFSGPGLEPIWNTADGRMVVGWWTHGGRRHLLVGLSVVDELVRYTQGDPSKVSTAKDKTLWGVGHERPAYLFEDNIVSGDELTPWADRLGFLLVRSLSDATGLPLLAPLPRGARGAILLTGDDDQAELAKYQTQQRLLDGFPITYLLLPHTRHTPETLRRLPASVEFGVHVDALDRGDDYDTICAEQTAAVRELVGRQVRTVRNHGHLNRGYWSHLAAWERNGLSLDFHIRGLDGTCPTGSYLPFRVHRSDGSWSDHWSLFSTFSDSMLFLQKWPEAKQIATIRSLARSIMRSFPGVIVANFHPQNVDDIPNVHRALKALGEQRDWIALGGESYAQWLAAVDGVRMIDAGDSIRLLSDGAVDDLALHWPGQRAATPVTLSRGEVDLVKPTRRA